MNNIKICTVVTGKTLEEFLANLTKVQEVSELIELRVDYIENLKPADVLRIKAQTHKESIFTCRAQNEGGAFQGDKNARFEIITTAAVAGFDYIDLELNTIKEKRFILSNTTRKIVSYHNFSQTPDYETLEKIVAEMRVYEADIMKIATTVKVETDNMQLFKLLVNKKEKEQMIVVGMGELGKITRIVGPLLGSYLTFAAMEGQGSAPGQIEISQLKEIYDTWESP